MFKPLVVVDYVRERTVEKSCKCGNYGLFQHLLLFCGVVDGFSCCCCCFVLFVCVFWGVGILSYFVFFFFIHISHI